MAHGRSGQVEPTAFDCNSATNFKPRPHRWDGETEFNRAIGDESEYDYFVNHPPPNRLDGHPQ